MVDQAVEMVDDIGGTSACVSTHGIQFVQLISGHGRVRPGF